MFTIETLSHTLTHLGVFPAVSRIWIAYSGGLDSYVLLHALAQLRALHPAMQLQAIHVHHGLSPHADDWAAHCQAICSQLAIPLEVHRIDPQVYGSRANLEEVAREQRYQIFTALLSKGEYLLTAHHQDDQAETVLLRMLRGAGSKGVSAISSKRALGAGCVARPLLDISRGALESYARDAQLRWIEDESNINTKIDRNYLRHTVLPLLKARWPAAVASFSQVAKHAQEATQLCTELAELDWAQVQGDIPGTLCIPALKKHSVPRQKNILRFWLQQQGFSSPSAKKWQTLFHCLGAKEDAMPFLAWEGVEVRRYRNLLYAMPPLLPHDPSVVIPWDKQEPLLLQSIGWMYIEEAAEERGQLSKKSVLYLPAAVLNIRFRQGGEIMHPAGRIGSHPLKKLFQEWGIPPWMRDRIPLLYVGEELAMVVGYGVAEKYTCATPGWKKYAVHDIF